MSKYNLTDIYEGMTDQEWADTKEQDRLEAHPEKDKIKAMQALIQKEKSMKEDKYDDIVDADDDIPADKKKEAAAAYRKVDKGASYEKATSHIKEVSSRVGSRIEGLLNIPMKQKFLDAGMDLIQDLLEDDQFFIPDVIEHLAIELEKYYDGFLDQGDRLAGMEEGKAMSDTEAKLEAGVEGNMDAFNEDLVKEEIGPTGIGITDKQLDSLKKLGAIAGLEVYVQDKDGSNVRKVDYTLTNTNFEKDPDDIDDEGLREHFGRFLKDYQ